MQTNSIWKYRDNQLVHTFPNTPYIDTVYCLWCGYLFHVCNDPDLEWTADGNIYPRISKYGYGVLEEVLPDAMWHQSVGAYLSGKDIWEVADWFNSNRHNEHDDVSSECGYY